MHRNFALDKGKTYTEPIKWCRHLVTVAYATAALIVAAQVLWHVAARAVLAFPRDIYWRNHVFLPAIGLLALTFLVDLFVRSPLRSLFWKECLSLSLFVLFSFYLCVTHDIARVLLGSFVLPIFLSTVFLNRKITRCMFWMSCLAVLLLGVRHSFAGTLDASMRVQIFAACFMFLCSDLLAQILIRYGHDNLDALMDFDRRQQLMLEQLKLDPFTGLYNRKTFDEHLLRLMEECRMTDQSLSLAMMDVDHFKCVNDLYGHAVGDQVLLHLSQIFRGTQAENIHVFRIGGEEFAVLFQDCGTAEAYPICEEIRTRMESAALQDIDQRRVTLSCGLACMNSKITNPEALTKAADFALYAAKNGGRNQCVIDPDSIPALRRE